MHNCPDLKHLLSSLEMLMLPICPLCVITKFVRDAVHIGVWTSLAFLIWNRDILRNHPDSFLSSSCTGSITGKWSFGMISDVTVCTWRPLDSSFLHCLSLNYPWKVILIHTPLLHTKETECSLRRLQLPVTAGQWHPLRCCASPFFHRGLRH